MTSTASAPRAEYPALDGLEALRADWDDDPSLTDADWRLLTSLPSDVVQAELTATARQVEDHYYALLDSVRSDTTRELLREHAGDTGGVR
jgi:hypothetical protein